MTFSSVALVILNLFRESVEYNLATLLPGLATKPVTNAAFSVARYKIKIDFFLELNQMLCEHIESLKPKLWKGFRLIAGDGTSISLPPSPQIKKHFGIFTISTGNTHTCLANACMFYDVFSNLVVDVIMAPVWIGENTLMYTMIDKVQFSNSIILLDRGFGYISTCKKILNKQLDFCIRVKSTQSVFANNVMSSPFSDFITEWMPSDQESSSCKKNGLDPGPIKVWVTKVILNTGEIELLVSSILDLTTVNESDMQQFYEMRWAVEEGFKKLKPKMKLEQFGCRRYEGVYQEFYAYIFNRTDFYDLCN